ncbi:hypothetical protein U3516DRAFT_809387 [Neocallimastix sp. 'constans']
MEKNLEIEINKTNRGKEQIFLNRKYKFNLSSKRKDDSKNINNQILEYDDSHNHLENKFEAAKSIVKKKKIKDEISNSSIPFSLNIKRYNSIKSQVTRSRRKQLPPDITTFDKIPNESKYYKTKRDENFMIFKNNDLIKEESKYYIDYERRIAGILKNKNKKKLIRIEDIKALVKYY